MKQTFVIAAAVAAYGAAVLVTQLSTRYPF